MLELGPDADRLSRRDRRYADGIADVLVTVGPLAAAMAREFHGEHHHAADAGAAAQCCCGLMRRGDVGARQGSNGVGLKLVCETLTAVTPA